MTAFGQPFFISYSAVSFSVSPEDSLTTAAGHPENPYSYHPCAPA